MLTAKQNTAEECDTVRQERESMELRHKEAQLQRFILQETMAQLAKNHNEEVERLRKELIDAAFKAKTGESRNFCLYLVYKFNVHDCVVMALLDFCASLCGCKSI